VPLLRRRAAFSGTGRFRLYDALTDGGVVDENVYAYSNGSGGDRSLVLVNHRFGETNVRIDHSVGAAEPDAHGGMQLRSVRLLDALELGGEPADRIVRLLDGRTGWELRRSVGEIRRDGLWVQLGAYEARVLSVDFDRPAPEPAPAATSDTDAARPAARKKRAARGRPKLTGAMRPTARPGRPARLPPARRTVEPPEPER